MAYLGFSVGLSKSIAIVAILKMDVNKFKVFNYIACIASKAHLVTLARRSGVIPQEGLKRLLYAI